MGWDVHLQGSKGLEEFADQKTGLEEITNNGQQLNFYIEGSLALTNLNSFVGNNNERVGKLKGESTFWYYPILTPLVSYEPIVKFTLTYDYTPQPVPEPTTSVGIAMSFFGLGMLIKKKRMRA